MPRIHIVHRSCDAPEPNLYPRPGKSITVRRTRKRTFQLEAVLADLQSSFPNLLGGGFAQILITTRSLSSGVPQLRCQPAGLQKNLSLVHLRAIGPRHPDPPRFTACRMSAASLWPAAMLPSAAPSTDVGVTVGDVVRNSLKTDSLTDSQHSSGDIFPPFRLQARALLIARGYATLRLYLPTASSAHPPGRPCHARLSATCMCSHHSSQTVRKFATEVLL